jgi:large subunit ribosomal protein L25
MEFVQIEVKPRPEQGTGKVRRLRRDGQVPAVLYGLQRPNMPLTVPLAELDRFLRSGSRLVELKLEDKTRAAILREVQHDPVTDEILHVDFVRVDKDVEVEDRVPIVYKGRPKGTATGGIFQAVANEVLVRCRPLDLPREIVYDVGPMELHAALHAKDLPLPANVQLLTPGDDLLAHVVTPKVELPPTPVAEGEAVAEPELIRKPAEAAEEEAPEEKKGKEAKEKE